MGLFNKKPKVDLNQKFKDIYKEINQVVGNANKELDFEIKLSLLQLANQKYEDLLELIDQGADFERKHFENLKQNLIDEIEKTKGL